MAPDTWDLPSTSWTVISQMMSVPSKFIAAALVPGLIIAVLFYFDHNVSSQLAQQEEFNLTRGTAYHWDLFVLGIVTIIFGLPPINGVIPQSPMHTKALSRVVHSGKSVVVKRSNEDILEKVVDGSGSGVEQVIIEEHDSAFANTTTKSKDHKNVVIQLHVAEQRGSGLLQSLLVGSCLAIIPAIRCIPTSVLWGYFAFMAAESLPGSQLWDRTCLLLTDPKRRVVVLERGHALYLEIVKYKTVVAFTLIQILVVGGVYGLTWAGLAGVLFLLPIMALVPFRQYVLPRWFSNEDLNALDKLEEEEAAPLGHDVAVEVAAFAGLAAGFMGSPRGSGGVSGVLEIEELLDTELHHYRVVHHLSEEELANRRWRWRK